eukprot:TRINITY_DN2045_c0_g4_i1.p1 TRINITY_DN2045_c0_g4~~TRINITY_DN2045_c0_g4_i1.p1  ORF type:complete len:533 (-),score=33.42 TRINITY_DN2045_c0_g4_i1:105-1703(-)
MESALVEDLPPQPVRATYVCASQVDEAEVPHGAALSVDIENSGHIVDSSRHGRGRASTKIFGRSKVLLGVAVAGIGLVWITSKLRAQMTNTLSTSHPTGHISEGEELSWESTTPDMDIYAAAQAAKQPTEFAYQNRVEKLPPKQEGYCPQASEWCAKNVQWARTKGVFEQPKWYPGLSNRSTWEDFQSLLSNEGRDHCSKPCMRHCEHEPYYTRSGAYEPEEVVRILHVSDTHSLHWEIERFHPMPAADILIHTGDMSNYGNVREMASFNDWLGRVKHRYPHIFVITGNHDWVNTLDRVGRRELDPENALGVQWFRDQLTNAVVLDNEEVNALGIRIFGSGWLPWFGNGQPGDIHVDSRGWWDNERRLIWNAYSRQGHTSVNRYDDIPEGVDVLLTHGPAYGFFDEILGGKWGSSKQLLEAIQRAKPKVHLFGHVHEQRGVWDRDSCGGHHGALEYETRPGSGKTFKPRGPPSPDYPVDVVDNNAMENNAILDSAAQGYWHDYHIAGGARLIIARRKPGAEWSFSVPSVSES